jgi:hypothetical protein
MDNRAVVVCPIAPLDGRPVPSQRERHGHHGSGAIRLRSADFRQGFGMHWKTRVNLALTIGVANMSPKDHAGFDQRAAVLVKVENGGWRLIR